VASWPGLFVAQLPVGSALIEAGLQFRGNPA
jgi:hypothetical protein